MAASKKKMVIMLAAVWVCVLVTVGIYEVWMPLAPHLVNTLSNLHGYQNLTQAISQVNLTKH